MIQIIYKDTEYQIKHHLLLIRNCLTFIFLKEIIDSFIDMLPDRNNLFAIYHLKIFSYIKL